MFAQTNSTTSFALFSFSRLLRSKRKIKSVACVYGTSLINHLNKVFNSTRPISFLIFFPRATVEPKTISNCQMEKQALPNTRHIIILYVCFNLPSKKREKVFPVLVYKVPTEK